MASKKISKVNAGLMTGAAMSGAGSGIMCLEGDNSIVCNIKRTVGSIQGIIYLLFILFIGWYLFKNRKNIFG